jgi:hypothetical protein
MLEEHQTNQGGGVDTIMTKKSYQAPTLQAWGSIVSLTHVGNTNPDRDCFGGSVYPPGHANGCPTGNGPN